MGVVFARSSTPTGAGTRPTKSSCNDFDSAILGSSLWALRMQSRRRGTAAYTSWPDIRHGPIYVMARYTSWPDIRHGPACPGHPNQHHAASDGPDKACPCEGGGRAMMGKEATSHPRAYGARLQGSFAARTVPASSPAFDHGAPQLMHGSKQGMTTRATSMTDGASLTPRRRRSTPRQSARSGPTSPPASSTAAPGKASRRSPAGHQTHRAGA
jgi:hypothetical protein